MVLAYRWLEIPAERIVAQPAHSTPVGGHVHAQPAGAGEGVSSVRGDGQYAEFQFYYDSTNGWDACHFDAYFPPTPLPTGTLDGVYLILRHKGTRAGMQMWAYYSPSVSALCDAAPEGSWGEPVPRWLYGVPLSAVESGAVNNAGAPGYGMPLKLAVLTPVSDYMGALYSLDYIALMVRVPYNKTVGHGPPRRVHPRDDGLAGSSAPRTAPGGQSVQGSNRVAGGYL